MLFSDVELQGIEPVVDPVCSFGACLEPATYVLVHIDPALDCAHVVCSKHARWPQHVAHTIDEVYRTAARR